MAPLFGDYALFVEVGVHEVFERIYVKSEGF